MASKQITRDDIEILKKEVKNEVKLELTQEDTERRHEDRNKLNVYYFKVDELKESVIKITSSMDNMQKWIIRLENLIIEHIKKEEESMEKLLDKMDEKYAGKWTEKILVFIGSSVWTAIMWALMYLIFKR